MRQAQSPVYVAVGVPQRQRRAGQLRERRRANRKDRAHVGDDPVRAIRPTRAPQYSGKSRTDRHFAAGLTASERLELHVAWQWRGRPPELNDVQRIDTRGKLQNPGMNEAQQRIVRIHLRRDEDQSHSAQAAAPRRAAIASPNTSIVRSTISSTVIVAARSWLARPNERRS